MPQQYSQRHLERGRHLFHGNKPNTTATTLKGNSLLGD